MTFIRNSTQSSSSLKFVQPLGSLMPAWLYEVLPFIYMVAGTTVSLVLGSVLAICSGVLLMCAGIHVLRMRRHYRITTRRRYNVPMQIGR